MKRIITLAIATAAVAAMAIAATSASAATVLCNTQVATCSAPAKIAPVGSEIGGGVSTAAPETSFSLKEGILKTINCGSVSIAAKTTAEFGLPLSAEGDNYITPANCAMAGAKIEQCTSVTMNNPPETIESTGSGTGVIRMGTAAQPLTISFNCYTPATGTMVECSYAASSVPLEVNHGEGTLAIKEATMTKTAGSSFCAVAPKLKVAGLVSSWVYISTV